MSLLKVFLIFIIAQRGISGRGLEPSGYSSGEGGFTLVVIGFTIFLFYQLYKDLKKNDK